MEKWDKISTLIKGLLVPITFLFLWLAMWIYSTMQVWEVNHVRFLAKGLILLIVSCWTYTSVLIKNRKMTIGLYLLATAVFLKIMEELMMMQTYQFIPTALPFFIVGVAFVFITLGFKEVAEGYKLSIESIKYIADTDALTKLPNRRAISKRVEDLIEAANREGTQLAIFLLDFDNFKCINDAFGHEFGDQVLVNMARQLDAMFSNDFFWGRLGGDEFLVVQKNVKNEEEIDNTSKKIIQCFDEIQVVDGCPVHMPTSIGVSIYPKDGTSKTELLRKADMALYKVKNTYKNSYELYTSNLEESNDSHNLKVDIMNGLKNNEFEVHFQPIISLSEKNTSSFEALVRWYRSDGVVSPAMFIPVAEMYGLINSIDLYVLRRVCENYKRFRNHGYRNVSINLSARTITKPDLIKEILKLIEEFAVCPTFLTFEITETAIIRNESKTFANINSLKELGCKVSLDDFGTGYSSLNHLRNLPVNTLKIDKTFIDGIGSNHKDELVVKAVLCLANDLGIGTIAEGVERKEQVDFLHAHGCHKIQGYYFSKPMKLEEILILNVEDTIA